MCLVYRIKSKEYLGPSRKEKELQPNKVLFSLVFLKSSRNLLKDLENNKESVQCYLKCSN